MKKILIEGWRGINHSYALVNQNQLLALRQMDLNLAHHDLPFYQDFWNSDNNDCGFDTLQKHNIASVRLGSPHQSFDVTYRISFPYRLYPANSEKLFVFGTAEFQTIDGFIFEDRLQEGIQNSDLRIVTPSEWSKVGFMKAGFKPERVIVISHGVNRNIYKPLSRPKRSEFRSALKLRDDEFIILSLGAMTHNKGIDLLLRAYAILKKKYPQIKLILKDSRHLYGIRAQDMLIHYFKNSESLKEELLQSVTFIANNLTQIQLNGLYSAADCYVSPYRAEGFNLTPLEAVASGSPIIVSKGGATDDYFHNSFGLQIDCRLVHEGEKVFLEPQLDSLIERLTIAIEQKTGFNNFRAQQVIDEKFTWPKVVNELVSYF